ncbi:flagellin [Halogeometricum borinquense]|uniref:Flagellin n=2 Tax=Halogeometricum borinquense TaxID=60847 RepID=E4NP56_HALBP|nr:archaellin/type IV pilin N-terminal domain-containing protein [Halogeometricum borinquense]ADQ67597.1 archaeal flagellin-like protein [Halogeometricum borinquense DSM 11551]ELY23722.1 flagellin-like protein [Halogeometricum borinquense DSM 11551]QIB73809.1 flagellin [Halogeometricum borinquense]QIQ76833.1 flagellin [Halogeometricum borinquense]
MFEKFNNDDRGQVGIGTLIVFIAMVLVAAIAAGVLVNTAGFLQATAEDAGQESVNKVTNRVEVLNTHGEVGDDTIRNIQMTVRLAAGSSSVDMNETSVKYLSATTVQTLTNQTDDDSEGLIQEADSDEFALTEVTDDDGSFGVLNSMNDRYGVTINTTKVEAGDSANHDKGLKTGEQVTLEITSRTGGTTQVILTMPQQLAGKNAGDPVEL